MSVSLSSLHRLERARIPVPTKADIRMLRDMEAERFYRGWSFPLGCSSTAAAELQLRRCPDAMAAIVAVISDIADVTLGDLLSERRARRVARPRQLVMYLAKELTDLSYPQMGRVLRRDHTTVQHGIKQARKLLDYDEEFRRMYRQARKRLGAK